MQPWQRRIGQGLVNGIVRADEEIGAHAGQLVGRGQHQRANAGHVAALQTGNVFCQIGRAHGHFRMAMTAHHFASLDTNCAIAKCGALGGTGDDAGVRHH